MGILSVKSHEFKLLSRRFNDFQTLIRGFGSLFYSALGVKKEFSVFILLTWLSALKPLLYDSNCSQFEIASMEYSFKSAEIYKFIVLDDFKFVVNN